MPETPVPLVSVSARVEAERLLVDYRIQNRGSEPVCTYDGAAGAVGEDYPDLSSHRGVYVIFREPATLHVKRILVVPPGKTTQVLIPAVYRLEPGETRHVKLSLPAPVTEKCELSPHFDGATYEPAQARALQLVVGFMSLPSGSSLHPFPADPRAFKVVGSHGPQDFASGVATITVPVRKRTDSAFRRV